MKKLKRINTAVLTVCLLLSLVLSLASCSTRLRGTYSNSSNNLLTTTYVFEGKTVKKSQTFTYNGSSSAYGNDLSGEYDISYRGSKDGYEITFIWEAVGKYAGKSEEERSETYSFKKTNSYIKIGDEYYQKQA